MKMKKSTKIAFSAVAMSILFSGCGSSDTTSSGTNTGYFVDAAVVNAQYKTTSGIEGTTDNEGRFEYKEGDKVTFCVGKLILGETVPPADGLVTPKDLADQNETIVLMLQTLQSLDSDNNASNGITIDPDTLAKLNELDLTISLSDLNESQLVELDEEHDLGLDEDHDGHLDVDVQKAMEHMNESVYRWKKEHKKELDDDGDFDLDDFLPTTNLTQELKDALAYMGNEERLAHDIYLNLYNFYKENSGIEIKQFYNIATKSESKHIAIVQDIVKRYDLNTSDFTDVNESIVDQNDMSAENMPNGVYDIQAIQDLYDSLYAMGQASQEDALKVGCMVEVTDINDLDEKIELAKEANATDIVAAFEVLREGSYHHYWAFDKALKSIGVENGCYYEGDLLLTNKEGIYPQNEKKQNEYAEEGMGGVQDHNMEFKDDEVDQGEHEEAFENGRKTDDEEKRDRYEEKRK